MRKLKSYIQLFLLLLIFGSCDLSETEIVSKPLFSTESENYYREKSAVRPDWGTYGIPSQPTWGFVNSTANSNFYSELDGLSGEKLADKLREICAVDYSRTDYDWSVYRLTDEDPRNTRNVITIYKGLSLSKYDRSWNREHVFARSNGGFGYKELGGSSDAHHIRVALGTENSRRSNYVLGSGYIPRDAVSGDVSRMCFYVALIYNKNLGANIDVYWALQKNYEDKVDDWEMHQNNTVERLQGNRNPFIDHPELAEYIFGSKKSQVYHVSN